jgi:ubiquitin carboxyl-terminal hydrolase 10
MRSQLGTAPVNFPLEEGFTDLETTSPSEQIPEPPKEQAPKPPTPAQTPTTQTSQTSQAPSETGSTDLTTPSPAVTPQPTKSQQTPTPQARTVRPVVPIIPAVPILPLSPKTSRQSHRDSVSAVSATSQTPQLPTDSEPGRRSSATSVQPASDVSPVASAGTPKPASPPPAPKSWADLVRSKSSPRPSTTAAPLTQFPNGLGHAKSETLSDVLNAIDVTATQTAAKIAFLKPRGLVNTGNMCYMNSVCMQLSYLRTGTDCSGVANFGFLHSIL